MTFSDLYLQLVSGTPIKRKPWRGYWKFDPEVNNIRIFTKEGGEILITDTQNVFTTFANIACDDWEVATSVNCDIVIK